MPGPDTGANVRIVGVMCVRYTFVEIDRMAREYAAANLPGPDDTIVPRYNAGPTQELPLIVSESRPVWRKHRFGFSVPAPGGGPARLLLNARAETLTQRPAYRRLLRGHRCLIPADGFYEWEQAGSRRLPHYFQLSGRRAFFFAGLLRPDTPDSPGGFVLVTTTPNPLVARIHDRMPVILEPRAGLEWLGPGALEASRLPALCAPYPAEKMTAHRVGTVVNSIRHDAPDCIAPVESDPELPLRFT